jgi:hypothetical protein
MSTPAPDTTPAVRRGGYLPVLPDGWVYRILISDRADENASAASIDVVAGNGDGEHHVYVNTEDGRKTITKPSLPDAVRVAVDAAKALDRLAKSEAEFKAARQAALDSIGGDAEDDAEPMAAAAPAGDEPTTVNERLMADETPRVHPPRDQS